MSINVLVREVTTAEGNNWFWEGSATDNTPLQGSAVILGDYIYFASLESQYCKVIKTDLQGNYVDEFAPNPKFASGVYISTDGTDLYLIGEDNYGPEANVTLVKVPTSLLLSYNYEPITIDGDMTAKGFVNGTKAYYIYHNINDGEVYYATSDLDGTNTSESLIFTLSSYTTMYDISTDGTYIYTPIYDFGTSYILKTNISTGVTTSTTLTQPTPALPTGSYPSQRPYQVYSNNGRYYVLWRAYDSTGQEFIVQKLDHDGSNVSQYVIDTLWSGTYGRYTPRISINDSGVVILLPKYNDSISSWDMALGLLSFDLSSLTWDFIDGLYRSDRMGANDLIIRDGTIYAFVRDEAGSGAVGVHYSIYDETYQWNRM